MTKRSTTLSPEIDQIRAVLSQKFPAAAISAYRYNSASIRVRIIDKSFRGKTIVEREEMVLPLIRQLPEEIQADIVVLLTLAPNEANQSLMNHEFEHPSPSRL